ncbi:PilZ domain-containing protein [Thermomonas sp.]|uniref:PilZ domain-containing protein n=1 Tax=Thermomonas sp. TaxID=1971895 RepID=UPI00391DD3EA
MSTAHAEATLFGDALACEDTLRAAFLPQPVDPMAWDALCARAEIHLSAIAIIEDSRNEEEEGAQGLALRRIEAKLDLLLTLVGGLGANATHDPPLPVRWSAQGACLPVAASVEAGQTGLFRVQAATWLPEPLTLPARVIETAADAAAGKLAWLAFEPLPDATRSALERHLFRQHRRAVAGRRAAREVG